MSKTKYKREFICHDLNNKVLNGEAEIYDLNGYDELHIRFDDYDRDIKFTDSQYELFKLYEKNKGLMAGFPIQNEAVKDKDYDKSVKHLKSIGLYEVKISEHIEDRLCIGPNLVSDIDKNNPDATYPYGTAWLRYNLEDNIKEQLNNIIDKIEKEDKERVKQIEWNDIDKYEEELENLFDDDKIIALGKHLGISPFEANEDICEKKYGDFSYSFGRQEYYVCTNKEADDLEYEYVKNLIEDCYIGEATRSMKDNPILNYIDLDGWIDDWCGNRGENLAGYDGYEYEEKVNGVTYYIYRTN